MPVRLAFKKRKIQVKSPSFESRVSETGSDPPIGSDRDSGRDNPVQQIVPDGIHLARCGHYWEDLIVVDVY